MQTQSAEVYTDNEISDHLQNPRYPRAKKTKEYRQTLEDVLRERLLPLKIPVAMDLPFGHIPHNATLPVGAHVTLDATNGRLIVGEPAVA